MAKTKFILIVLFLFAWPGFSKAASLDSIKADFLNGDYARVIAEGQAQLGRAPRANADELNYILGLSYLNQSKFDLARACFKSILNNSDSKFQEESYLALGDTYLVSGQFTQAEQIYNKIIVDYPNTRQKAAVLYRLSQLGFKQGDQQKGNNYWLQLKSDFPFSPELRLNQGLVTASNFVSSDDEYSVQVGFFENSANANNLKNSLLGKNYPAYVESFNNGFRVRVGKFKTKHEALESANKLSQEGLQTKIYP